ncbi:MAG TPA: hypothetical protein VIM28_00315 [Solirubrobacterales bacterium]
MRTEEHTPKQPSAKSGLFAALSSPLGERRSGAPSHRPLLAALGLVLLALALALTAAPAGAAQTHVPLGTFCEPTGIGISPCEPSFSTAASVAVDQSSGDLLVIEAGTDQISRYHSDGTPSDFSALATNVIDGVGPGADQTPQNGLGFDTGFGPLYGQIAVDESGTATDGDIYVTQNEGGGATTVEAIDIFSSTGEYLGQITGPGAASFDKVKVEGLGLSPCGVAVDPAGNLYVGGWREEEIYKFDPAANPPVNADHVASFPSKEPCRLAAGAGSIFVASYGGTVSKLNSSSGALDYVFPSPSGGNDNPAQIAVNPGDGHLFIATYGNTSKGILDYDVSQGSGPILVSNFGGGNLVAVDGSSGKVYLDGNPQLNVYSPLVPLPEATSTTASNIGETTASANGAVETFGTEVTECKFEYGLTSAYGATKPCAESAAEIGTASAKVHADLSGLAPETVYHYRLLVANANGAGDPQGKDQTFQTIGKPQLLGEWAEGVGLHEARIKALINPQSAATTYRFEWGLGEAPYEHSTAEISIGSEPSAHTVSLQLSGLALGTVYHYRVVATNHCHPESAPATACVSEGADHELLTFPAIPPPQAGCPNQAFRTAASAALPDCRAYEMVSPVDKNGGDITTHAEVEEVDTYVQASPDGNSLTYSALWASFAGEPNSFAVNQYLARRVDGEGWSSQGIHPPVSGGHVPGFGGGAFGLLRDFMGFSADLCTAWLIDYQEPSLAADALQGHQNLYKRQNCGSGAGSLETLTPAASFPELPQSTEYVTNQSLAGVSEDSRHAILVANGRLTDDASTAKTDNGGPIRQVYDHFGGANHLVSVLPGGVANPSPSMVGSGTEGGWLHDAVSGDGSHVYWTSTSQEGSKHGRIYLRVHPEQGIVAGECGKATKACTAPVSANITTPGTPTDAFFWAAAADGSEALYGEGDEHNEDLYEFDLKKAEAEELPRLIAHHVVGVVGAAEDLSRFYFVSTDALEGAGQNSEGDEAVEGQANLYLDQEGATSFVGALLPGDLGAPEPGAVSFVYSLVNSPFYRAARVTPDGARLVFQSRASLTGYDNTDSAGGKPALEVFTYRAGGALRCVSCNPSGARPGVGVFKKPYRSGYGNPEENVPAAAWIPTWEHLLHASNVVSADGERIFFNSFDALLPRDTNGAQDVYEWEVPGAGGCREDSADYFPDNGGCLYLISSGESSEGSEFWEASPDGKDVFLTTASSLLPQDPGSVDIYDARIGGGFPPPGQAAECEGEACQSPPGAPDDPTPASAALQGAGNVAGSGAKPSCRKPKVRRKGRCVAKHGHRRHRSNRNRRAAR